MTRAAGARDDSFKAAMYARWRRRFWLLDLLVTLGFLWGVLATGLAQSLASWVSGHFLGAFLQVALYTLFLGGMATLLTLPIDWLRGFYLEHRFQLSTQGFFQWLGEYVKRMGVGGLLGLMVVECLAGLLRLDPQLWWVWFSLFWLGWSVLLARIAPTLLIPIFYRQKALADPALEKRLREFLSRCGAKVRGVFEIDLSRNTRKANACLTGLGKSRRVLLSDTLVSSYPPEEVEVVLAHELGHHRLRHIGILIGVGTLAAGVTFFLVDRIAKGSMQSLGVSTLSELSALPLIGLLLFLGNLVLTPLLHGISRRMEAQADLFALKATGDPKAFIEAMRRLAKQNLAELSPPRWAVWLLYDHPPITERIAMAQKSVVSREG